MRNKTAIILSTLIFSSVSVFAEETVQTYDLGTMNITSSGYEKSNLETPADISVYTAEDLEKTGASNVADALKFKTGIYFTQMGPHGQNWITNSSKVILRGIDKGTLVLVNGVPTSFNGVSHLDSIDLAQVERVEVVKGGGAVLYGSDAFGGVINVITKKEYKNSVKVAAGDKGKRNYSASINANKLNITASHDEQGATDNMSVDESSNSSVWGSATKYKISFGKSKKDTVGVNYVFNDKLNMSYRYTKKDYSLNYNAVKGANGLLQHFDYDDEEHYTQINYTNKDFTANAFYNQRNLDNPDYRIVSGKSYNEWEKSNHKVYGLDVKQKLGGEKEKFLIGASMKHEIWQDEREKFSNIKVNGQLKPDDVKYYNDSFNNNVYSIYGQYDKALSNATDLIVSGRQEFAKHSEKTYKKFLPQAQLITKFDEENSVYVSAGKSFSMPNLRTLHYASGMIEFNPNLEPESGKSIEAGYKFDCGDAKLTVALFNTKIENQIVSVSNNGVSKAFNISEYKNRGLETRYERKLNDHVSFNVGTVFGKPQRRYAAGQEWVNSLGRYQVNGGVSYDNRDFEATLSFSYWGDRVTNGSSGSGSNKKLTEKDIPGTLLVSNLHLGYKLKDNMKLTFDVDNIFDRKDICNVDTSSSKYYTNGRNFLVGLNYSF